MVETLDLEIDNTSDHVPIQLNVSYSSRLLNQQDNQSMDSHGFKVTRLGTLSPPKTEGQLSICRQVNSLKISNCISNSLMIDYS